MSRVQAYKLIPKAIRQSLRYRLLAFLLVSLIVLMSITLFVVQRTADHEFGEILDGQLIVTGRALFSVIALELREGHESALPEYLDDFIRLRKGYGDWLGENTNVDAYDNEFYLQLVDPSGKTVFASQHPPLLVYEKSHVGLFMIGTGDDQWQIFSLQDTQTGYTFYTGQSQALRQELSRESIEYILQPFVVVTIIILGAIWLGTRYGLKPLTQLTQELNRRTPDMLETIDLDDKATELRPLVTGLNGLFTRVSKSMATERQFSADASHELRTPLAGIKANLDVVRILSKVPEQQNFLDNIEIGLDNATQITEALLLLSRVQSSNRDTYFDAELFNVGDMVNTEIKKRTALNPSCSERIRFANKSQGQEQELIFKGPKNLVQIAIGNILDNALKYSSELIEIDVLGDAKRNIVVSVNDYGPGIPEDALNQVFQRFYRIDSDTTKGFGLGLALVQQIMSAVGGCVQLSNRSPRGLNVTLTFPAIENS